MTTPTLDHPTFKLVKEAFPGKKFRATEFRGQSTLIVEPGMAIVNDCVRFLTRVEAVKRIGGRALAEAPLRESDRRCRDVEDGHVRVAAIEQIVDEGRLAAAYVDDRRIVPRRERHDLTQGRLEVRGVPAHAIERLGPVDRFPMRRWIDHDQGV